MSSTHRAVFLDRDGVIIEQAMDSMPSGDFRAICVKSVGCFLSASAAGPWPFASIP